MSSGTQRGRQERKTKQPHHVDDLHFCRPGYSLTPLEKDRCWSSDELQGTRKQQRRKIRIRLSSLHSTDKQGFTQQDPLDAELVLPRGHLEVSLLTHTPKGWGWGRGPAGGWEGVVRPKVRALVPCSHERLTGWRHC